MTKPNQTTTRTAPSVTVFFNTTSINKTFDVCFSSLFVTKKQMNKKQNKKQLMWEHQHLFTYLHVNNIFFKWTSEGAVSGTATSCYCNEMLPAVPRGMKIHTRWPSTPGRASCPQTMSFAHWRPLTSACRASCRRRNSAPSLAAPSAMSPRSVTLHRLGDSCLTLSVMMSIWRCILCV